MTAEGSQAQRAGWADNLGEETAFWRSWFVDDEHAEAREGRLLLSREAVFPAGFAESLGLGPGGVLRALDVGSGPISTLPRQAPANPVELVCTDALADVYNALLDEFGYDEVPRVLTVKGEELSSAFPEQSFHYVNIANALDHCEDPAKTLSEMYRVCRPGGMIVVVSVENEGANQQYQGLHQWNLEADDRSLWLWTPSLRQDLLASLGAHEYSWRYLDEPGVTVFLAEILRK